MQHGRDHDQRLSHISHSRHNNTPPDGAASTPDEDEGRASASSLPAGIDCAPTERAARREHERHRLERELGRTAAGTDGQLRDERADVSRAELDEVARRADRAVGVDEPADPIDPDAWLATD